MSSDDVDDADGLSEEAAGSLDTVERAMATLVASPAEPVFTEGAHVGRYELRRRLGAGAMGVVWAAHDPQLDRNVALKILRRGAAGPAGSQAAERAAREARALARLIHPNIVAVHDGGLDGEALYVVMELVEGVTLRAHLADRARSFDAILDAFVQAGAGLAAAHDAKLVHRDFKPDNVLVGDDGRVRVADFGLARIAGAADAPADAPTPSTTTTAPTATASAAIVGTLAYMAPEQMTAGVVDHRADQFAFAVSWWGALFGAEPFSGDTFATRRASIEAGPTMRSGARKVPAWLLAILRRALSRDPDARFPSMPALLAAVARGRGRRRRLAWIAAAVVGLTALGGGAVVLLRDDSAARAVRACDRSGDRVKETWTPARRAAIEQAFRATGIERAPTVATRVGERLDAYAIAWRTARVEACHAHRRGEQSAPLLDLRDHCLDRRRAELDALSAVLEAAPDAALVDRAVEAVIGLGDLRDCADVPRLSGAMPRPTDTAAVGRLGHVESRLVEARILHRAGKVEDGLKAAQAALSSAEAAGFAPLIAEARLWLGYLQTSAGDPASARATFDLATRDAAAAHDDALAAEIWVALFQATATKLEQLAEAEKLLPFVEAALVRAGSPPKIEAAFAHAKGNLLARQGKFDDAGARFARALALYEETYGPDDMRVALVLNLQGGVLREQRDFAAARALFERALRILEDIHGAEHPRIAATMNNLANVAMTEGAYEEARLAYERVVTLKERLLGPDHPELASTLINLGFATLALHRPAEAVAPFERVQALATKKYGPEHPMVGRALRGLGEADVARGDDAAARPHLEAALAILDPALGADNPEVTEIVLSLGELRGRAGERAVARREVTRAETALVKASGPEHIDVARALLAHARLDLADGDPAAAARRLVRVLAIVEAAGMPAQDLAPPLTLHAEALAALGQPELAQATVERAAALHAAAPFPDPRAAAETSFVLATILWSTTDERPRAVRLAAEARDAWTALGFEQDAERAAAWLRTHRP